MEAKALFLLVGYGLTILGGASGVVLFARAAFGSSQTNGKDGSGNRDTLWGLFWAGLIAGLILVAIGSRT